MRRLGQRAAHNAIVRSSTQHSKALVAYKPRETCSIIIPFCANSHEKCPNAKGNRNEAPHGSLSRQRHSRDLASYSR